MHLTESDVLNVLVNLKATGMDNIASSILKNCACALAVPLCHLFATSLDNGVIPTEWKIHMIIPVCKFSDKTSAKNYQPISLLCNISKVFKVTNLFLCYAIFLKYSKD